MKAEDLDKKFDDGEDVLEHFDLSSVKKASKRVNVDFPAWMVESLDKEAVRLGVTRQSLIKLWLADKLESLDNNQPY
ncbi:type II toxin-antitoxin system BrnA family antitoxin [Jiulongibacter sediminis]|uniref:type II toxin-antitoxin system BrnA family antitoxin n=1 Tax=Jiulongibacter sediminis TaxID=1605367 RepID=UPI0026F24EC8|nr:CopG family antitoxin [Jiulongibacter sediminis]